VLKHITPTLEVTLVKHLSRVLAAIDFSKPARTAFEYALALSRHHGAELVVVHAVPPNESLSWEARERLALLAELRRRASQSGVQFKDRVQRGDPAEIILLHARSLDPDVIVMGTHQRSGMNRVRAGSVAERVAAKATAPVLLVPRSRDANPVRPFRHVAVAVDFSASSHHAIEHAFAVARNAEDRITLLHVVPGSSSGVPPHLYRYGVPEYQGHLVREARRRLQLAVPLKRRTPAAVHARVLVGDTASEIDRVVDSIGADLLVVGVPQRSAVSRALFGTTAARLLERSRVPMLAVPEVHATTAGEKSTSLRIAA
jgi:nucleotide-binding universal stress UspA family protein